MRTLLVIPAYRESARLPPFLVLLLQSLDERRIDCDVQVVDDGSGELEIARLRSAIIGLIQEHTRLLPLILLHKNRGKGGAVRAGLKNASRYEWVGFVDADGAIPVSEVCRILSLVKVSPSPPRALFGCRIKMLGRSIERSALRHLFGRAFASFVGPMINSQVYDSQCGLKLIPACVYRQIEPWLEEDGFCFDVEWIAALMAIDWPIEEIPIDWVDQPGSKVSLLTDTYRMLLGVRRIQRRLKVRSSQWQPFRSSSLPGLAGTQDALLPQMGMDEHEKTRMNHSTEAGSHP